MDISYRKLFQTITVSAAQIAERVMDLDTANNDNHSAAVAEKMRDDYTQLMDKIESNETLNKNDYAKLLVAVMIIAGQLDVKIKADQKTLAGYKADLIPKLDKIIKSENEEEIQQLANELFKPSDI